MGIGSMISKVGQSLGLMADPNAGAGARADAMKLQRDMVERMQSVNLPEYEKMAELFANMEPAEFVQQMVEIGPSAMEQIATNPKAALAESGALSQLQELAQTGYSEEDRAKIEEFRRTANGDEQARQKSILQDMATRGTLGSGSELAAKLSSSQASADRANRGALQLGASAAEARRGALAESGRFAGNMLNNDFNRQSTIAQSKDAISKFNAANRQVYQQTRQQRENNRASLEQQKAKLAAGLEQQKFSDNMSKTSAVVNQMGGLAAAYENQAAAEANAAQQSAAAIRGMATAAASAMSGGLGGAALSGGSALGSMKGNNQVQMNKAQNNYKLQPSQGLTAADGNIKRMAYDDGGTGTIIPGDSYSGDELNDSLNSGEMVLNLTQQDRINKLLREYSKLKGRSSRVDEMVDDGDLSINDEQQESLLALARGDIELDDLPDDDIVLSEEEELNLERLLGL